MHKNAPLFSRSSFPTAGESFFIKNSITKNSNFVKRRSKKPETLRFFYLFFSERNNAQMFQQNLQPHKDQNDPSGELCFGFEFLAEYRTNLDADTGQ